MVKYLAGLILLPVSFSCATPVPKPGKLIKRGGYATPPIGYTLYKDRIKKEK